MSFFKTAKSTFMSTNDLQSNDMGSAEQHSYQQAWQEPSGDQKTTNVFDYKSMEGSDLAANPDFIVAGGTMSILRRKGKEHKKNRQQNAAGGAKGMSLYNELLTGDIQTLLRVFHDEANNATVSITL